MKRLHEFIYDVAGRSWEQAERWVRKRMPFEMRVPPFSTPFDIAHVRLWTRLHKVIGKRMIDDV